MSLLEDMIRAGTCRYNDNIKKTCQPLFEQFHLSSFGYLRVKNAGDYFYVGSHAGWSEFFMHQKLYLNYPYFRNPKFLRSGVSIPAHIEDESYKNLLASARRQFHLHHSLILLNKTDEGVESFSFCTKSEKKSQLAFLLNELPLLRLFVSHFQNTHKLLFSRMEDYQVNLAHVMGPLFNENPLPELCQSAGRKSFLQKMGVNCNLSPIEKEILGLLAEGLSAKEVGLRKLRSTRTVEHHIERIKDKLRCSSKGELVQKGRELEKLGCLSESI